MDQEERLDQIARICSSLDKRVAILETKEQSMDGRLSRVIEQLSGLRQELIDHIVDEQKRANWILLTTLATLLSVLGTAMLGHILG